MKDVLVALKIEVARQEGKRVWCLCPSHQKPDDPKSWATAFFVRLAGKRRDVEGKAYQAAGQYFCFSCGIGGSLRQLVMEIKGFDEAAAIEFIRKRGGKAPGSKVEELKRVVTVVRSPVRPRAHYRLPPEVLLEPLSKWVSTAQSYARDRCKITDDEVDTFGLGYAVDGTKLSCRIVFPCRGRGGAPAHYSARTFIDAEPRYTTPGPDEPDADRSVLFGEHLWPTTERRLIAITEGSINSLAVRRALAVLRPDACYGALGGAKNFSPEHGQKLATFGTLLVLTDPDAAGDAAARALEMMVGRYARLCRIRLPVRGGRKLDALDVGPEYLRNRLERALSRLSC